MNRSWRIQFMYEPNRENFYPDEENAPDYVYDETEFDTDSDDTGEIIADMINLFNDFCAENHFEDVTVEAVEEVFYDGEEE